MKKALITGARGFIGKYVAKEIKSLGIEPLCFKGDIFSTDFHAYMRINKPEYLIHLAWVTGDGYLDSYKNTLFLQKSLEIYHAFYENGGECAFFTGTEQEYERTGKAFNETSPLGPSSLYAKCKAALGTILLADSKIKGFNFVWGRIFFVYGPGEKPKRLMPSLITELSAGKNIECSNDRFVRDYIYVKDLAGAICHCLLSGYCGAVNLAGGRDTTIGEIADAILRKTGRGEVKFKSIDKCNGQPAYLRGDISLLESLGWQHKYSLEEGLQEEILELTGSF